MPDFSILIVNWFRQNARNLPWRQSNDPYFIWLSEVILQQTRVDQGLNYYLKFTTAFPEIADLAKADEDQVLNLWQGLGYYSRARNLHHAAKQVMTDYKGEFPDSYSEIRKLKGVGDYTAAAISSIAFHLPYAVVDGNVYRVLSRYFALDIPVDATSGKKKFAALAQEILDRNNPGDHNQAVMELGALICTPKSPQCDQCPLADGCLSRAQGTMLEYPVKVKKTKVRDRYLHYYIVTDGNHVLIRKRTGDDIWKGLYDFPLHDGKSSIDNGAEEMKKNFKASDLFLDAELTHLLSHQRLNASFYILKSLTLNPKEHYNVVSINALEDYPLPQLLIRYIANSVFFRGE